MEPIAGHPERIAIDVETPDYEHFLGRYACEATSHGVEFEIVRDGDGFTGQMMDGWKIADVRPSWKFFQKPSLDGPTRMSRTRGSGKWRGKEEGQREMRCPSNVWTGESGGRVRSIESGTLT
jgi:hypothetical protein